MSTIYANATIYTQNDSMPQASSMLVDDDGRIAMLGEVAELREHAVDLARRAGAADGGAGDAMGESYADARGRRAGAVEEIDCGGSIVLPGLTDAHMHSAMYADALAEVDLRSARSLDECLQILVRHEATLEPGLWMTGGRWDYNTWETPMQPSAAALDRWFPDRPVSLTSIDYHTLWVNSAALAAAGIGPDTPDPVGGKIGRGPDGRPDGILRERAGELMAAVIPKPSVEERAERMSAAQREFLSVGLTGVHDIDGFSALESWQHLSRTGAQTMRVYQFIRQETLDRGIAAGWRTGDGDEWIRKGHLKVFADGALGSHTCHMSVPFPGATGEHSNFGMEVSSPEQLDALINRAVEADIAVGIHAIGDQANHQVLDAFERALPATRRAAARAAERGQAFRHRIEHAQLLQPADVARFGRLGVVASMQPRHCISDLHLIDALLPRARGGGQGLAAYAWGDITAAGGEVAFGTDGPVEPADPFASIYAAMTRADIHGDPATTFEPQRRLSAAAAIASYSVGSARASGQEASLGRLAPGFLADFIIVDTDPYSVDGGSGLTGRYASEQALFEHALAVRDTAVQGTVVGGEIKFSR